ncbi:MAG: AarF/ABC1/UbiB kinase family protein [Archangiaceae bacterium]|nr:AarF/ABC1/UbiB kinase family protein [Archangiaceae bacterium]
MRSAFQDLNRLRQIAIIAGKYGFADLFERSGLKKILPDAKIEGDAQAQAMPFARRFRMMLAELGPTFVKLGQVLSTRGDLLPAEFIEELSTLQDRVPPFGMEDVRKQMQEAFGRPLEELFRDFDETPIAAASMAQVHKATTHDGVGVVVKVQRPGITERMRADLSVLHGIARALEAVIEEVSITSPTTIIEEFDKAVHEELDFLNEASNVRAFMRAHENHPTVRIPKVYDELSGRTVLTLEFLDGPKLSNAQLDDAGKKKLANIILEEAFKQLFEDGLFHGDPHPGNLLILDGPVLALIDFGLVGRVTHQMQEALISLILAVALKDSESVARQLYRLGTPESRANLHTFKTDIDAILNAYLPTSIKDVNAKALVRDLLNLAVKYRVKVPREYAILARASVAIEGILRSLYPEMPIGEIFMPYARKMMAERYDPSQLQGNAMKTLLRLQSAASDLPLQLQQIMLDLESGKFTITLKDDQVESLNSNLRALAVVAFAGLCACGFIIGTFLAFAPKQWEIAGIPVMGLLGIGATVFLFSTAMVRQVIGSFRKVSIKRFLGKR